MLTESSFKVGKMAAKQVASKAVSSSWTSALRRWAYEKSYFPQLGLMRDDTLYEDEYVKEALRRIPKPEADARMFRLTRALDLSGKKIILPREEWTKLEEDRPYLQAYLEEVKAEAKEKKEWNKQ